MRPYNLMVSMLDIYVAKPKQRFYHPVFGLGINLFPRW